MSFTAVATSRELLREHDICFLEFGAFLNIDSFLEERRITGDRSSERVVMEIFDICLSGMVRKHEVFFFFFFCGPSGRHGT